MSNRQRYSGRLELTWTNKDKRLLAHDDISYEWVDPADYRISEVRLLRDAGTVGDVGPEDARASDNLVIRGDALHALTSLASLPEFAVEYAGKVKLVYIDPPFNTGGTFQQYDDNLEHSVWLTMMRDRLLQIRDLLAEDGSVWVHLDDNEMAHCRILLDEIFGRDNFIATVVWQKVYMPKNSARHFSVDQDYLLVVAKDAETWRPNALPRTEEMNSIYTNPDDDPRGPWASDNLSARNPYSLGRYSITTPSGRVIDGPPSGRYWAVSKERLEELDADGRIWWGDEGSRAPRLKRFLSEVRGRVPQTIWFYEEVGHTQDAKKEIKALFPELEPFATPKPEALMQRVLRIASDPGDLVLDCFGGSGTTAAVAHKMGRRWAIVEWSEENLRSYLLPRLKRVVEGSDPGGITKSAEWTGGGGLRILDVAPSMFAEDDGMVFLSDWAIDSDLAEATTAQLRYTYEPESPFCGRRGRSRLAVMDGIATPEVLGLLVGALAEGEKLVLCATAIAPDAHDHLAQISKGSKIRKIPASILADYRVAYRTRRHRELKLEPPPAEAKDTMHEDAPT